MSTPYDAIKARIDAAVDRLENGHYDSANTKAAIAQAEALLEIVHQLTRVADALEGMQDTGPAWYEKFRDVENNK